MLRYCPRIPKKRTVAERNYVIGVSHEQRSSQRSFQCNGRTLIGYKSAGDYIVEMDIRGRNTIDRPFAFYSDYAPFRTDAVYVNKIYHKITKQEITNIPSNYDPSFIYSSGEYIHDKNYDTRSFAESGGLISVYLYLAEEPAFYYDFNIKNYTGEYKRWYDNGAIRVQCNYINGKKEGELISYYPYNGVIEVIGFFVDGRLVKYQSFTHRGKLQYNTNNITENQYYSLPYTPEL